MKKKPSKAKRSPAKAARPMRQLMITFPAASAKQSQRRSTTARHARVDVPLASIASRLEKLRARVKRRPVEMQHNGYALPADVAVFLRWFHDEPAFYSGEVQISVEQARRMIEAAYMDGCRQGYIEGFVVRREIDRQRSRAANNGKRKAVVTVGTRKMTRDERDAAMVDEYAALLKLMKPTPACQRLASKYEYESWQGVAAAIKRFHQRAGE